MSTPAVEAVGISKRFPGVVACDGVSLSARAGEVHAVVGENGAGKTTLMRVLAGLTRPDAGEVRIDGRPARFKSAAAATRAGIGMVHQHFTLVPVFTVLENVILGREPPLLRDVGRTREALVTLMERTGLAVDPDARVSTLTVGERQRVEILRTLHRGARILILDEPTSVLTPGEARELYRTLRRLADEGRVVLFISHRLSEVLEASDRVTVMRRGRHVATLETAKATERELARLMVGRDVVTAAPGASEEPPAGETALEVRGLGAFDARGIEALRGVDLEVRSGEILGIAGVMGNGQRELLDAVLGTLRAAEGVVRIAGEDVTGLPVRSRLRRGLAIVPEDRQEQGLVLTLPASENLALGLLDDEEVWRGLLLREEALRARALREMGALDVRPLDPAAVAETFSGGNQQKVLVARALAAAPRVLLLAEPTRGLDVGAIERVHAAIRRVRSGGAAVLLVSSDLAELLALSDRVLVMRGGRLVGEVKPGSTDEEELGLMMAGGAR
ncbi:MAG: ABC transporter ATP-binding protein [Planctomycetota bacterium]